MKEPRMFLVSILLILLFVVSDAFGGGKDRAGTTAAPQLSIPVGARYLAMGGSPVAVAKGLEAIYWNPAGLDITERSANALFSYRSFIADIGISHLAVSGKFDFGSLGLSIRSIDIGDIPVTTEAAPDGTGEIFSPTYFIAGLTFSNQLTDRIAIGLTVNLVSESWARVSATGVAFDAGVQYRNLVGVQGLTTGIAIKSFGPPMQYDGPGLFVEAVDPTSQRGVTFYKVEAGTFELPSVIEIGLAYSRKLDEMNQIDVASTFQNNNFDYDQYRIGLEYSYNSTFFLRGGYLVGDAASKQTLIFQNYTLGAGLKFTDVGGTSISIDYGFVPVQFFDNNHVISIGVGF